MKTITLYMTLVFVSSGTIVLMTGASVGKAITTAAVGCILKTFAVKIHEWTWEKYELL